MRGRTERLADTLARALPGLDLAQRRRESQAMAVWPEIVGPTTASKTRPAHVNRGVMVVKVASAAWANQLNLLKGHYLEALAERVGPGVVGDLRWRIGSLDGQGSPPSEPLAATRRPEPLPLVPLPPEVLARIESQVGGLSDPGLADRVRRVLVRQASRREALRAGGWTSCTRCGVLHDARADGGDRCPPCIREHD